MPRSPQRYAQLARALKILTLLEQSHFGKTLAELRDEVVEDMGLTSLHVRSVQRDLKFLQDAGFHIEPGDTDRGKVWKLSRNYLKVPSLPISVLELLAFSAGRDLLEPLAGTPYWKGIEMLWRRMREGLPESVWEHFDRQRPGLIVRGRKSKSYASKDGILSSLNRAIYEHRLLEISYRSPGRGTTSKRRIEPHALVLYQGSIYVVAAQPADEAAPTPTDAPRGDPGRKEIAKKEPKENDSPAESPRPPADRFRLFKLDRLNSATPLDQRFKPGAGFRAEDLFENSIGVYCGGRPEPFEVRCDASVAQWAVETPFHPRQVVEEQPDGSVVLRIASGYESEIISRVLSLGEHAELLSPASAREKLAGIVARLAAKYRPGCPSEPCRVPAAE